MLVKNFLSFICILYSIILQTSCKEKGCTDQNSINYNVNAEEDNGSCLYCDSIHTYLASKSFYLTDDYLSSSHYNEQIARFDIEQYSDTFNFIQCGTNGCKVYLTITNLLNQNMEIDYAFNAENPHSFYSYRFATIKANSTQFIGLIGTQSNFNCRVITNASAQLELRDAPIYY